MTNILRIRRPLEKSTQQKGGARSHDYMTNSLGAQPLS